MLMYLFLGYFPSLKWLHYRLLLKSMCCRLGKIYLHMASLNTCLNSVYRCGDAAWSIDVAIQYPKWIVVGLDDGDGGGGVNGLSFKRSIPRNFKFIRRNSILQGLKNLPDGTFDFIALRLLLLGYTFEQYQALVTECLRVCKPGGYVEVMEMDMRIYHQRVLSSSVTQLLNNEGMLHLCCCHIKLI